MGAVAQRAAGDAPGAAGRGGGAAHRGRAVEQCHGVARRCRTGEGRRGDAGDVVGVGHPIVRRRCQVGGRGCCRGGGLNRHRQRCRGRADIAGRVRRGCGQAVVPIAEDGAGDAPGAARRRNGAAHRCRAVEQRHDAPRRCRTSDGRCGDARDVVGVGHTAVGARRQVGG